MRGLRQRRRLLSIPFAPTHQPKIVAIFGANYHGMDTYLDLSKEQYLEFMQYDISEKFQMLNLLKFVDKVPGTKYTGLQQYKHYMKVVMPYFIEAGAKVIYDGNPYFTLIGPAEYMEWDKVLIIEYATKGQFINMISSLDYPGDLRKNALADSRLILCK